jgi:hypothetical protein
MCFSFRDLRPALNRPVYSMQHPRQRFRLTFSSKIRDSDSTRKCLESQGRLICSGDDTALRFAATAFSPSFSMADRATFLGQRSPVRPFEPQLLSRDFL